MRRVFACVAGAIVMCVGAAVAAVFVAAVSPPAPGGGAGGLVLFLVVAGIIAYLLFAAGFTLLRRGCFGRGDAAGRRGTK